MNPFHYIFHTVNDFVRRLCVAPVLSPPTCGFLSTLWESWPSQILFTAPFPLRVLKNEDFTVSTLTVPRYQRRS